LNAPDLRSLRGARAVVTGGAGFLGSHMVDALVDAGADVIAFDSLAEGARENVNPAARLIVGDIRDDIALRDAVAGADYLLHFGAIASVPRASQDPALSYDINTMGTVHVLDALRRHAPKATMVLASSASVYGNSATPIRFEETAPTIAPSPYASTKLLAEAAVDDFTRNFGVDGRVVRFTNVIGPRAPRYILFDLYRKVRAATDHIELLGSGNQQRDFLYCTDAAAAVLAVIAVNNPPHRIYNVPGKQPITVRAFAERVAAIMGKPYLRIETSGATWLGDVDYLLANDTRIREVIGLPEVSLDEGIKRFVAWMDARMPAVGAQGA